MVAWLVERAADGRKFRVERWRGFDCEFPAKRWYRKRCVSPWRRDRPVAAGHRTLLGKQRDTARLLPLRRRMQVAEGAGVGEERGRGGGWIVAGEPLSERLAVAEVLQQAEAEVKVHGVADRPHPDRPQHGRARPLVAEAPERAFERWVTDNVWVGLVADARF